MSKPIVLISPKYIVRGASTNNRHSKTKVDSLAQDIMRMGLISPVTVRRREDSKYDLLNGFRRYDASLIILETNPGFQLKCEVLDKGEEIVLIRHDF